MEIKYKDKMRNYAWGISDLNVNAGLLYDSLVSFQLVNTHNHAVYQLKIVA